VINPQTQMITYSERHKKRAKQKQNVPDSDNRSSILSPSAIAPTNSRKVGQCQEQIILVKISSLFVRFVRKMLALTLV